MLGVMEELLVVLQLHEETRSVIARGKDRASVANQQTAAVGKVPAPRDDVGSHFNRWLIAEVMAASEFRVGLASVVPEERHRILLDRLVMVEKMRMLDGNGCLPLGEFEA